MASPDFSALSAFSAAAREYCAFVDSLCKGRPPVFYRTLEDLLARLQSAILPVNKDMPREEHPEFDSLRMTHDQWKDLAKLLANTVTAETSQLCEWHLSIRDGEGTPDDEDATRASMLWDDLADIYRDLQHGLTLCALGTDDARAEASWHWRFNYEFHWGEHLFRAMTTVHEARYQLFAD